MFHADKNINLNAVNKHDHEPFSMSELRFQFETYYIYEEAFRSVVKPNEVIARNSAEFDDLERE